MLSKQSKKRRVLKAFAATISAATLLLTTACGKSDFKAGAPESITGEWRCEDTASDGKTDTGFYAMYVEKSGKFSIYDAAAGNPGISGNMGNYTGSTVECEFIEDDFDPPFCWDIELPSAVLDYEVNGDTLKLGYDGVWLIFHREAEEAGDDAPMPQALGEVLEYSVPTRFELDMEYPYGGDEENPVIQRGYTSDEGYISVGIFSYKGRDCSGDGGTVDLSDRLDALSKAKQIEIDGETGYFGTHESDDMPDMAAAVYVEHGDYIFTLRITNGDEQVTEKQMNELIGTAKALKFK